MFKSKFSPTKCTLNTTMQSKYSLFHTSACRLETNFMSDGTNVELIHPLRRAVYCQKSANFFLSVCLSCQTDRYVGRQQLSRCRSSDLYCNFNSIQFSQPSKASPQRKNHNMVGTSHKRSTLWSWKTNYQPFAVVLVLGHWSVKCTLKRMMGLNKVKVSWEIKYFLLKLLNFCKYLFFLSPLRLSFLGPA